MNRPIVLSYFSQGNPHLENIVQEANGLQQTWHTFARKINIEYFPQVDPSVEQIIDDIRINKRKVIIFHFSGHAAEQNLFFDNGAANANGLAGLLGEAYNLKMVFLNGCGTYDQVNLLLNNNVKIIIATRGNIEDGLARQFSELFYKNITAGNGTSIKESFLDTINSLITLGALPSDTLKNANVVSRGLVINNLEQNNNWGLFVKKGFENEIVQNNWWKLKLYDTRLRETLNPTDFYDHIINILILIFALTGLSVFVYFIFKENFQFSIMGGFFASLSLFGYKNQKKFKTVEFNSDHVDDDLI